MTTSNRPPGVRNIFSIDVEDLDALNFASMQQCRPQTPESRVCASMDTLLEMLGRHGAKATMFFLGRVVRQHPQLVRQALAAGHEIASHGYAHQLVYRQTAAQFREDVRISVDLLQQITGQAVCGYRAPSWSISADTPWAYDILLDLGFVYDASLFPFHTYLYGDGTAPVEPFVRRVGDRRLYEIPASVLPIMGRRIPFGGGFYLRIMPWMATRLATWLVNRRGRPVVFYLHPREIDPHQPRFKLPTSERFIAYANLHTTHRKVERILALGPTVTVYEYLQSHFFSAEADAKAA